MIMSMIRPETEMKDTGIEWIGIIPSSWTIFPANGVFSEVKEKNTDLKFTNAFSFKYGEIVDKKQVGDVDNNLKETLSSYTIVRKNTIMINGLNLNYDFVSQRVAIVNESGVITSAYLAIQPDENKINPRFVLYLLKSYDYQQVFHGLGSGIRKTLKYQNFKKIMIVAPTLSEQQAIADYLDETCSKIDEIIAEAKASIDEYKELKQSVIFDGISLGIRKCCDYKKTTLKGIEKIPNEWGYRKLKFLIKYIESGVSVNAGNEPAKELEYGVLKTSCVSKMIFLPNENKSVNKDEYDRVKCPVCGNTIIVSRMNTPDLVGACAYIEKDINNIFLPDRLWQVHFKDDVNVKYVYYCLISTYIRNYYSSLSTGTSSSMQNISQGQFANAIIPYPSSKEQKEIADFLDKRTVELDSLIAEKESLIADLEAYKKSLIYEVVTGKRRVV